MILGEAGCRACGPDSDGFRVQPAPLDLVAVAFRRAPGNRCCEPDDPDAWVVLSGYARIIRGAGWCVARSPLGSFPPVLAVAAHVAPRPRHRAV